MLEIQKIQTNHYFRLGMFFEALEKSGASKVFHPHPFTMEQAEKISNHEGKDLYYLMMFNGKAVGYAMLRGYDEGYDIPSLGIAIHPDYRGKGLSKVFMQHLHCSARLLGAKKVMLKVYKHNTKAAALYRKIGYDLKDLNEKEYVGYYEL